MLLSIDEIKQKKTVGAVYWSPIQNLFFVKTKAKDKRKKRQEKRLMKHNFKNLKIWILSMEIASDIHKIVLEFPKNEVYGLMSQMNRAAVSMPSNIAEGSNRENTHFKHFLNISLGSSFELQTQLLIAIQNKYLTEEKGLEVENKIIEFQKMTTGFISKLG